MRRLIIIILAICALGAVVKPVPVTANTLGCARARTYLRIYGVRVPWYSVCRRRSTHSVRFGCHVVTLRHFYPQTIRFGRVC